MANTQNISAAQIIIDDVRSNAPYSKFAATFDKLSEEGVYDILRNESLFTAFAKHFLEFQLNQTPRPTEDGLCCLLYELFQTGSSARQLFVLCNLPYFLWAYLSGHSSIAPNPNLEACLLGLYNASIATNPNYDVSGSFTRKLSFVDAAAGAVNGGQRGDQSNGGNDHMGGATQSPLQYLKASQKSHVLEHMLRILNLNIHTLPDHATISLLNVIQWICCAGHPIAQTVGALQRKHKATHNPSSIKLEPFIPDTIQHIQRLSAQEQSRPENGGTTKPQSPREAPIITADLQLSGAYEVDSLVHSPRIHLSAGMLLEMAAIIRKCIAMHKHRRHCVLALQALDCRAQYDVIPEAILAAFQISSAQQNA